MDFNFFFIICKTHKLYRKVTLLLIHISKSISKSMTSLVYLIRNGDLYVIGSSNNMDKTLASYSPGELVASQKTDNPEALLRNLRRSYIDNRLPSSDYFRLSNSQARECQTLLGKEVPGTFFKPFFTGYRLFVVFAFFWLLISLVIIQFAVNPIFGRF